jgi:phosphatidyl-myo-inositol alpha-mannosyltransferase
VSDREAASGARARPIRVALLTPRYWPEVRRGAERFTHELAHGLHSRGHIPRILTSHPGRPRTDTEDGVTVVRSWRPPDGRLVRREYEDHLTHVPFSWLALRAGQDAVAQALYPTDALAAARWSHDTGRPAVLSWMGVPTRRWLVLRRGRAEIVRRAVRGSAVVTALSRTASDAFERWLGAEVRVIYPGVDLGAFEPGGERAEAPTVFCAAAIDQPQKRVGLLIAAFRELRRDLPDARLVLAEPRDGSAGRGLIRGVEGIELRNVNDREELARSYREAWVSALPSWGEAFGLVLVESLACGTPVVGSSLGAIPEVVDREEIGRLFDGDDPASLARALREAIELSRDTATRAACRARAEEFGSERTAAEYERVYRELIR